jgi:hypothetical protein
VEALRFREAEVAHQEIGKLHGLPDLPPHYLPRAADLAELKRNFLAAMETSVSPANP